MLRLFCARAMSRFASRVTSRSKNPAIVFPQFARLLSSFACGHKLQCGRRTLYINKIENCIFSDSGSEPTLPSVFTSTAIGVPFAPKAAIVS